MDNENKQNETRQGGEGRGRSPSSFSPVPAWQKTGGKRKAWVSRCVVVMVVVLVVVVGGEGLGEGRCTRQKGGRERTTRRRLPLPTMRASHPLCADVRRGRLDHNKTPLPAIDTSKDSRARRSLSHAASCAYRFEQPALASFLMFILIIPFDSSVPPPAKANGTAVPRCQGPRRYHRAPPRRPRAASSQHEKWERQRGRERSRRG